jgi:hypothetical protein
LSNESFGAVLRGLDNQSQLLNTHLGRLVEVAGTQLTRMQTIADATSELIKAQLIIQREMAEALDQLSAAGGAARKDAVRKKPSSSALVGA